MAILGGLMFLLALGHSFTPRQGWKYANELAGLGIFCLGLGGVLNLICTVIATAALSSGQKMDWWYPLNLLATIGASWGGWVALNL